MTPSFAPMLSGTPGDMTIQFQAVLPGLYSLEWSENLIDWNPLGETRVDVPRLLEFEDDLDETEPPVDNRFYRIGILSDP